LTRLGSAGGDRRDYAERRCGAVANGWARGALSERVDSDGPVGGWLPAFFIGHAGGFFAP